MSAHARGPATSHSRPATRLLLALAAALVAFSLAAAPCVAYAAANSSTTSTTTSTTQTSTTAPSSNDKVSLSAGSDGPGSNITIMGSGLAADAPVTASFGNLTFKLPLQLKGDCTTNAEGGLAGCTFLVPSLPHAQYTVTVSDGTNSLTATFTIPVLSIPDSTLMVTGTSLGLSLVTQLVTRRVVDLDAERRMKAEVSAFTKEKREATLAKDKAKLEKLKKRELPMRQEQAKVSTARLKVTAITFVPLLAVYYLMASYLGGFTVIVAHSPVPIPYLVGSNGTMALFWWYMLSSFTVSTLMSRLLHTTP